MRLKHTTLVGNWPSISRRGLLKSYSQGSMKAVWLHDEDKTAWAFLHVVKRHGGDVRSVVTMTVDVPDDAVKRTAVPGLYYVLVDVPAANITGLTRFQQVAVSPLEGRDLGNENEHRTHARDPRKVAPRQGSDGPPRAGKPKPRPPVPHRRKGGGG